MQLEIRHLRLIKAVAEQGSIAKAIDILHLTPSALSHQLREAEHQMGARIFDRSNKRMTLTGLGERLLEHANVVLAQMEKIEKDVRQFIKNEHGEIRVSVECYTNHYWLPSVLKKFSTEFPDIALKVAFDTADLLIDKLEKGERDLIITSDPVENDKIDYVELFDDEMLAVVSNNHMLARRAELEPEHFKDQNLIIFTEPIERVTVYKRILEAPGIMPKVTVVSSTETAIAMVAAGAGIMVAAKWALKPYLDRTDLKLLRVTKSGLFSTQYAAMLKDDRRPVFYDYFIKYLSEEIVL